MRFTILAMLAGSLLGQDKPAEPKEAAIIQVKTLTGDSFDRLMRLINVFGVNVQGDSQLHTIVVYAPKDVVAQMRRVVEELDRPGSQAALGKDIEMTMTFLRCSGAPVSGAVLPPEMEPVVKQLRAATTCKDPTVWDTMPMRLQEGRASTDELMLPGSGPAGQHATVTVLLHPEAVYRRDKGKYVRFSQVKIDFRVPVAAGNWMNFALMTSGDFMEGQKTIVGKVSGMPEDEAIFAVIALKVLE